MRGVRRNAAALVAGAFAASLVAAVPAPALAQVSRPALEDLAGCVRSEGALAVEVVVDESGSLRDTDPQDNRVAAVSAAIRNLEGLANVGTGVAVQLSVFSVEHRVLVPFVPLSGTTVSRFTDAAADLSELDRGIDTDFAAALTAARAGLSARPEKCTALLLFTDGNYDLQPGSSRTAKPYAPGLRPVDRASADRLEAFGRDLLCRGQGTTDQLRVDGTKVIVVPLTTGISAADQRFLEAIANGKGAGGETCGVRGSPRTGAYLPASEFGELLDVFDDLTSQLAGGTKLPEQPPVKVCAREACPSGQRSFTIDPGIRRFHVLVDLGVPGLVVEIAPPNGRDPAVLEFDRPATKTVGGVEITHLWLSPSAVSADVTIPPTGGLGVGTWTVTVIDPTGGRAGSLANFQVHVYGDLGAKLLSEPELVIGEPATLQIGLVDSDGTPLTPGDLVRRVQVTATVTDPASGRNTEIGRVEPDASGRAEVVYDVPRDVAAGSVTLTLTTTVTTRSGLVLRPTTTTVPLTVRPPADFPTVTPATIALDDITGTEPRTAELVVTGGGSAAGCVWVEDVESDALPPAAQQLVTGLEPRADSRETCLRVEPGQTRTLSVTVAPAEQASGPVRAALQLRLVSDNAPEELTQSVPVTTELLLPVDEGTRAVLFALLLGIGLLVPFVVLYVANAASARFAGAESLRSARVAVRVGPDDVIARRDGDGRMLSLAPSEFRNVPANESKPTTVQSAELVFRRVLPNVPVRVPYAEVEAGGRPVTSSGGHVWRDGTAVGRLTLQLAGDWVFVLGRSHSDGSMEGDLHLFVGDSVHGVRPDEVVDRAARGVPFMRRLAAEVAERAPVRAEAVPAGVAPDRFGGLPSSPFGRDFGNASPPPPERAPSPPKRPDISPPPPARPYDDLPPPPSL